MDPVSILVEVIKTASTAMGQNLASETIRDLYRQLKEKLRGTSVDEAVDQLEKTPDSLGRQMVLQEELEKTGQAESAALKETADLLNKALQDQGLAAGQTIQASLKGGGAIAQRDSVAAGKGGIAVKLDLHLDGSRKDWEKAFGDYLDGVVRETQHLRLPGLDLNPLDQGQPVTELSRVYVDLDTTSHLPTESEGRPSPEKERLSALKACIDHPRLVLLGDPGSGKSTFVNHLAHGLARFMLEGAQGAHPYLPGWPEQESALLPLIVVLRDFAAELPEKVAQKARARQLLDFVKLQLGQDDRSEAFEPLRQAIQDGKALLLLDGIDEVPSQQRALVRDIIQSFQERHSRCRILATCRILAYQEPAEEGEEDLRLPASVFPSFELAPFDGEKIRRFIQGWHAERVRSGAVSSRDAGKLAEQLQQAVHRRDLRHLASNPLLLTVMAIVHAHLGKLPEARAKLYEETVEILLWRWERHKATGQEPRMSLLLEEAGCASMDLLRTLWEVAFEAHSQPSSPRSEGKEERGSDIGELQLEKALASLAGGSHDWAQKVIELIRLRSGLLLEREPEVFSFPHRTFQEFLAGAHLALHRDFDKEATRLAAEGAQWREVILLAAGKLAHCDGNLAIPLNLVSELCPVRQRDDAESWEKAWLAGDVLLEVGTSRVQGRDLGCQLVQRVPARLGEVVDRGRLTPAQRAAAGVTLARLGDPRPEVMLLEEMEFCLVPAGPFWMGSTHGQDDQKPLHRLKLNHNFWISRFPVTVAQYAPFVEAGGYGQERFWPEAQAESRWQEGQLRDYLGERERPWGWEQTPSNQPVTGVTWYEALAFCRWLSEQFQESGRLQADWKIRLPSEAEWEKAARGGLEIPARPVVGKSFLKQPVKLKKNPATQRRFPWGSQADSNHANSEEAGIRSPSAVGAFPKGESPYGCLEMSGNVWEWTSSRYKKYRYNAQDGREDLEGGGSRVLRGGSYWNDQSGLGCSSRGGDGPGGGDVDIGFRLALSP